MELPQFNEPGTIDDLVADARSAGYEVTARMIHDWTAKGLIDRPRRHGKGRGSGSDKGLYAPQQRALFISTLYARDTHTTESRSLARWPISIWLYWGDEYVPTRQADKAMRTWIKDYRASQHAARLAAHDLLSRIDHPDAPESARRILTNCITETMVSGRLDRDRLLGAVADVFDPLRTPESRRILGRVLGHPEAPVTAETFVNIIEVRLASAQYLTSPGSHERLLNQARAAHLEHFPQYVAMRLEYAAASPTQLAGMFPEPTLQNRFDNSALDVLTTVGLELFVERGLIRGPRLRELRRPLLD